jgi:uncharacterized membrane protein
VYYVNPHDPAMWVEKRAIQMDIPWTMRAGTRRVAILLCVTTVLSLPAAAQVDH